MFFRLVFGLNTHTLSIDMGKALGLNKKSIEKGHIKIMSPLRDIKGDPLILKNGTQQLIS